ncbi:hypothetical protein AVEN_179936-1 [Araneus ventricosus]|uniref:Uncharacterized protein n=1 Tax=Araneus ventricosus TaxID=182803 RepID=A0A4Y2IAU9_ARAVE|nr:hypothetical protein AVEN_179936-1 [Araneus ventricosus]
MCYSGGIRNSSWKSVPPAWLHDATHDSLARSTATEASDNERKLSSRCRIPIFGSTYSYRSAIDSETSTFGRFYTGKGCQAMSHMSPFPEFFVR